MNYEAICQSVQSIAKEAGAFIARERKGFRMDDVEVKGKANFVSYVDKQAEQRIVSALRTLIPEAGFIAEEGTGSSNNERYQWIIDPLDGTTNFIHGAPPYAVSIGLMEDNDMVVGVVFEITQNECFYAWKNSPAFLNGEEIHVTKASSIDQALVGTGFPYSSFSHLEAYIGSMRHFMIHSHGLRRLGSAATDLVYVAAGRFDAFFEQGLKPWDVAAGALIVQQAGGRVSDFSGGSDFLFNGEMVAANSLCFDEFRTVIGSYFKNDKIQD